MKHITTAIAIALLLSGCVNLNQPNKSELSHQDIFLDNNQDIAPIYPASNDLDDIPSMDEPIIQAPDNVSQPIDPNTPVSSSPVIDLPLKVDTGNGTSGQVEPVQGIVATHEGLTYEATIYRTNGYHEDVEYPLVTLVESKADLDKYVAANQSRYDMTRWDTSIYDEAYFAKQSMALIVLEEPSGSISHNVTDVYVNDGVITFEIQRKIPEMGTTDMAQYHVVVSLCKNEINSGRFVVVLTK